MDTERSDVTRKFSSKKALGTKAPSVIDDVLQLGGALDR